MKQSMSEPTSIELQQILPPEVYERLQAEANRQQAALTDVVRAAIEAYLEDQAEELEDTPDEKIEADFRQAWHEAMTGQTIPAREALAAIRKAIRKHDDQS
jgi:predicted DNA-binding protein